MNAPIPRLFISSTSEDLESYRDAARDEILGQSWHPDMMESWKAGSAPTIEACQTKVREAHAVLLIIAFRRGWVPKPEEGGDGLRSMVAWELQAAEQHNRPVLVLMAKPSWPGNLWEQTDDARSWLADFRGRFNRTASFFEYEPALQNPRASHPLFRGLVRDVLLANRDVVIDAARDGTERQASSASTASARDSGITLRPPDPLFALPDRPYPLLEPYLSPQLFSGRDSEVTEIRRLLDQRQPLLCLHAPSGAGKSSVLQAGLLPRLVADGVPVVIDAHPDEPELAERLLNGIAKMSPPPRGEAWRTFAERAAAVRNLAGTPPVFVLDQFETAFLPGRRQDALARIGPILASTFQRLPRVDGILCRWMLAYRQDFHGEVAAWLEDVLANARAQGFADALPHDLHSSDRCLTWSLPVLGHPRPGGDVIESATRSFVAAIETPLALADATGASVYRYAIDAADAERLARAFAEQRVSHPEQPLTPQLQVVLARLLADTPDAPGIRRIHVPDDPGPLVRDALDIHLREALKEAFPATRDDRGRVARTRALLALREMCDQDGRRAHEVSAATLQSVLGENGAELIERLAAPNVRLVVPQPRDGTIFYSLPHDSLAEVVSRVVQQERLAEFSLDARLLALWQLVARRSEFHARFQDPAALNLTRRQARAIARNQNALILDDQRRRWWEQASHKRRQQNRRVLTAATAALFAIAVGALVVSRWPVRTPSDAEGQARARALSSDSRQAVDALRALIQQYGYRSKDIVDVLRARTRKDTLNVLVDAPRHFSDAERVAVIQPVVEALIPDYGSDPMAAGALLAIIDRYGIADPAGMRPLRDDIISRLRASRSAPIVKPEDWVAIAMPPQFSSRPSSYLGPASASTFRIETHEVTIAEYLRFDSAYRMVASRFNGLTLDASTMYEPSPARSLPEAKGYPAENVSWFEAYAYAAWMGGHLPTEAQWQTTCEAAFPEERPRLSEPISGMARPSIPIERLRQVAWFSANAAGSIHPAGVLQADALRLHDLLGNADEWGADWIESRRDETRDGKPVTVLLAVQLGGSVSDDADRLNCAGLAYTELGETYHKGFRVILPDSPPAR